jgi:hypothetical protein
VEIWNIGKQESHQRGVATMHVQTVSHATTELDSSSPPQVSKQVNRDPKKLISSWRTNGAKEACLGIAKYELGTHSIRSGAAMAMYLGECPVYTIMLIGRWSSVAFLWYIRKQVMEFSHNVSKRMLTFQTFRHIPNFDHQVSANNQRVRNNPNNAETRRNVGGDTSRRRQLPAFSQFS